jgi:hypothetical protein
MPGGFFIARTAQPITLPMALTRAAAMNVTEPRPNRRGFLVRRVQELFLNSAIFRFLGGSCT